MNLQTIVVVASLLCTFASASAFGETADECRDRANRYYSAITQTYSDASAACASDSHCNLVVRLDYDRQYADFVHWYYACADAPSNNGDIGHGGSDGHVQRIAECQANLNDQLLHAEVVLDFETAACSTQACRDEARSRYDLTYSDYQRSWDSCSN